MIPDVLGLGVFLTLFGGVLLVLRLSRSYYGISSELSRKIAHILLGLFCLSFPWLFSTALPVLFLGGISVAALLWMRLRSDDWQTVIHGVSRQSWGEFYFPVAVAILYLLMENPLVDYVIPLLILTLADAVGALVGLRYGKSHYTTDDGNKSIEGSVAFFIVAFLSTHIVLLLGSGVGRLESLLIATILGLLIMQIEAVSWRGLDNLFIPLGAFLLLRAYVPMDSFALLARLLLLIAILFFFLLLRRRSYAKDGTLVAASLVMYLITVIGGWVWALPALATALVYSALCPHDGLGGKYRHGLVDLGSICGVALFWLFLRGGTDAGRFDLPYLASWSAQIAILYAAHSTWRYPERPTVKIVLRGGLLGMMSIFVPGYLLFSVTLLPWVCGVLFLAGALGAAAMWELEWKGRGGTHTAGRPIRQIAYGFAACLPGLALSLHFFQPLS